MAEKNGEFLKTNFSPEIQDKIIETYPILSEGAVIADHLTQKVGIVFLSFHSLEEYRFYVPKLTALIFAEIKD